MFTVFCLIWLTYRLTKKIIGFTYKQELKKQLKLRSENCENTMSISELEKFAEEKEKEKAAKEQQKPE